MLSQNDVSTRFVQKLKLREIKAHTHRSFLTYVCWSYVVKDILNVEKVK